MLAHTNKDNSAVSGAMTELDWQWAIGATGLLAMVVIGGWLSRRNKNQSEEAATDAIAKSQSGADHYNRESKLIELQQQLDASNRGLKQAQEENQHTLVQLHQVEEELNQQVLKNRDLQQKFDALETFTNQQEKSNAKISELHDQLTERQRDLKEAREEVELTLLQLHQVQEDLEHCFLESHALQQKVDTILLITPDQQKQLRRIKTRSKCSKPPMPIRQSTQLSSMRRLEELVQRQQNALRRFENMHTSSRAR